VEKPALDGNTLFPLQIEAKGEWAITASNNMSSQCRFIRCKDADAPTTTRDAHVPLLRTSGGAACGVRQQHMINGLALRAVGSDGVPSNELAVAGGQRSAIAENDVAVSFDLRNRHDLPVRQSGSGARHAIGFKLQAVAATEREFHWPADIDRFKLLRLYYLQ
jgi:hypothetical protein